MSTDSRAPKKILLRKKSADEELAEVFRDKPVDGTEAEKTELYSEGEIFEQFYRPLGKSHGRGILQELSKEHCTINLEEVERELTALTIREPDLEAAGIALADQIYTLAQLTRETDLDVYLSAFNVVLSERPSVELKRVLNYANSYFTKQYYAQIRERGERPEIFHQIAKRVGSEQGDRIWKIATGLDIEASARGLWNILKLDDQERMVQAEDLLLDLTEKQLRALRLEHLSIPFKELAKTLIKNLSAKIQEPEYKKTIARAEVNEQRKWRIRRSRTELTILEKILSGRTQNELDFIAFWYRTAVKKEGLELSGNILKDAESRLEKVHHARLKELFVGWTKEAAASKMNALLFPELDGKGLRDVLADYVGDRATITSREYERYLNKFGKRAFFLTKPDLKERTSFAFSAVKQELALLTEEQRTDLNDELSGQFGYVLGAEFIPQRDPSLRGLLEQVLEALEVAWDLEELLKPISCLTPAKAHRLSGLYEIHTGRKLLESFLAKAAELQKAALLPEEKRLFALLLEGGNRPILWGDLLEFWDNRKRPLPHLVQKPVDLEAIAGSLAGLFLDDGDTTQQILETVRSLSVQDREDLEQVFYSLTDPQTALLVAAAEKLGSEDLQELRGLLAATALEGYSSKDLASEIDRDPAKLLMLYRLPSWFTKRVNAQLKDSGIESALESFDSQLESEISRIDLLGGYLIGSVHELHADLASSGADKKELHEKIRLLFTQPLINLIALERTYDKMYPRLRNHLKIATAEGRLPKLLFGEIILRLEGIDPKVLTDIQECFDAIDIEKLQGILAEQRDAQRSIEEVFDLIHDETTLRRSVKDMKIDLDLINETLLHIEGYYSNDLAQEIKDLCANYNGIELGSKLLFVLDPETNKGIPNDMNWSEEMQYQIGLAFQRLTGKEIIKALRDLEIPDSMITSLTEKIYGAEPSQTARQIFDLVEKHKSGANVELVEEEKISIFLETRGVRHRIIARKAYDANWAWLSGGIDVTEDISRHFKNPAAKKRIILLLTSVAPVPKAAEGLAA